MSFGLNAFSPGLDPQHGHPGVLQEGIKQSDGIGSPPYTGDEQIRKGFFLLKNLAPCFVPDDALEIPDHERVGVGAVGRAEDVMRGSDMSDPIAHGLIDRFLEGFLAGGHRTDLGPEHLHPEHVQGLALTIQFPHVDHALHSKHGGHRGRGHAMLARPGFSNDPFFPHALGKKNLPHAVVDFVSAGVIEVFSLQVNLGTAEITGQPFGVIQGGGPTAELPEIVIEFTLKLGIGLRAEILLLKLLKRMHQGFGHIAAAIGAEMSVGIRNHGLMWCRLTHRLNLT